MDNRCFHNHSSHCHQGSLSAKPIKPSIRKVTTDEKVALKERANIVQPKPRCAYHEQKLLTRDIFGKNFVVILLTPIKVGKLPGKGHYYSKTIPSSPTDSTIPCNYWNEDMFVMQKRHLHWEIIYNPTIYCKYIS